MKLDEIKTAAHSTNKAIEITTASGDTFCIYAGRNPILFEYAYSNQVNIYYGSDSYAYTHGGELYRAACDAITEYLAA